MRTFIYIKYSQLGIYPIYIIINLFEVQLNLSLKKNVIKNIKLIVDIKSGPLTISITVYYIIFSQYNRFQNNSLPL